MVTESNATSTDGICVVVESTTSEDRTSAEETARKESNLYKYNDASGFGNTIRLKVNNNGSGYTQVA